MTPSEKEHRAEHARTLLQDDLFAEVLTQVRLNALSELATIDPAKTNDIIRQQAIVAVTGEIRELLQAVVFDAGEHDGGITATQSERTGK